MSDDIKFLPEPIQAFVKSKHCKLCGSELVYFDFRPKNLFFKDALTVECEKTDHYSLEIQWKIATKPHICAEIFQCFSKDAHYHISIDEDLVPHEYEITIAPHTGDGFRFYIKQKDIGSFIGKDRVSEEDLIKRIDAIRLLQ